MTKISELNDGGTLLETDEIPVRRGNANVKIRGENLGASTGGTGADGASAYEVWLAEGNTGTETDYLASLKGDKGDKGDTGNTGPAGPQGPAGNDGAPGAQGPAGADGTDGAPGAQGPIGPTGPAGADGADGDSWTTATVIPQAEAEAGTATTPRIWSAQRVKQAIDALAGGGSSFDPSDYNVTWDDAATTYTAFDIDVTDTASASGSMLADWKVGGVSKFSVKKDGLCYSPGGFFINSAGTTGMESYAAGLLFVHHGTRVCAIKQGGNFGLQMANTQPISWAPGGSPGANGGDLKLWRAAANTLAQRNGINPQASLIYNTYSDASNYERAAIRWSSDALEIGAEAAGTGTQRHLKLINLPTSDPVDAGALWNDAGTLKVSAG